MKKVMEILRAPALLIGIFGLLLLALLNTALLVVPAQHQLMQSWLQEGNRLAAELAHRATDLLTLDDRISLTIEVQRWARDDGTTGIEVIDPSGRSIAQSGQVAGLHHAPFTAALSFQDTPLGTVRLWQNPADLEAFKLRSYTLLLLSIVLAAMLGSLLWRWVLERQQKDSVEHERKLVALFPQLTERASAAPAVGLSARLRQLQHIYQPALKLLNELQLRLDTQQLKALEQRYLDSDQPGELMIGTLVRIDLLNLQQLENHLTTDRIKQLLETTRLRSEQVMRLYHAEPTQDPWLFVIRNHPQEAEFVQRALCAAYVLNRLLVEHPGWGLEMRPEFSISVMAGPLYQGIQLTSGLPMPTLFGRTLAQLDALRTHNQAEHIMVGEPVFLYAALGDMVVADLYRDITLPNSETLEVWRLTGFTARWSPVLERQIEVLKQHL